MLTNRWRRVLLAGAVVALGGWSGRAEASAFQLVEQNASGLGNAYAGQAAAAEDASTIFFNPAGLTQIRGFQVVGALNLVTPKAEFENSGSTPATLQPTLGGTGGDAGGPNLVPNLYLSFEALPNLVWAGLGVNAPFGLKTEWDDGWMGRFHALTSDVKTLNVNPTIAVKLHDWVSVGAGVNWQWLSAELSNGVNYSAIGAGSVPPAAVPQILGALAATCQGAVATGPGAGAGCEGVATVKGDDRTWGWNLGAMVSLPTKTRIGLSYRSAIEHDVEGNVKFSNRPVAPAGAPPALAGAVAAFNAALPDGDVKTTIELPETASVAISQQVLPQLQLLADFTWTGWSSIKDLSIFRANGTGLTSTPLEFEDSWRVGLGANYQVAEMWKLRAGVAYDKTPVKDEHRTPRLPDEDRTWLAGGAQWAFSQKGAIDVGFAYLFVSDASSNLPNVDAEPPAGFRATPKGTLVGDYSASVWIASAQARYSF